MKHTLQLFTVALLAASAQPVLAQAKGDWMVRAGAGTIAPQVTSGALSAPSQPNSQTDVGAASSVIGGVTYMYTDNISVDVALALPFEHKLTGAGSLAGVGQIGKVQALPATILLQYRFLDAKSPFRPYVGLGPTYAYFFNESGSGALTALTNPGGTPTKLKIDSQLTYTAQIGATLALNKNWFLDAFYAYTPLKTKNTLSTGQSLDITLDPNAYGLSLGYRF